jgi:uncharacterized Zn finger protein
MKVKVKNTQWDHRDAYFFEVPEFHIYEGDEVKVKWVKPEELALSTTIKDFSFRVIQRRLITELDDQPYSFETKAKDEQVRFVEGSKGNVYEVRGSTCTCPGYTFRGSCKHVQS